MPVVLRIHGARVVIYPNDHEPAHVHVMAGDCEAGTLLNGPEGPVSLREADECSSAVLRRFAAALDGHVGTLCSLWERFHVDR